MSFALLYFSRFYHYLADVIYQEILDLTSPTPSRARSNRNLTLSNSSEDDLSAVSESPSPPKEAHGQFTSSGEEGSPRIEVEQPKEDEANPKMPAPRRMSRHKNSHHWISSALSAPRKEE